MNILHINQSDIAGGAAIAAYRLHQGLVEQGINSKLLVGSVNIDSEKVKIISRQFRIENRIHHLTSRLGFNYINLISSFQIPKHHFYVDAEIINFHNLHSDYFNYLAIPKLTKSKPAVYTLHDMWSFTGHCAYSYDCNKWQVGCGQCPYLNTYPAIQRDVTRLEWQLKNWVYSQSYLTIVTPSRWLKEQAQASLLSRFPIYHIPHGIDTGTYQPIDPVLCRRALDIPDNKRVIMFASTHLKDFRKGGDLLLQSLQVLPDSLKKEILLVTLGASGETIKSEVGVPTLSLGYLKNDRLKSIAFSAADLFIFPTRADNLPLVLQESIACGTPVVSFDIGGVPDLVRPGITGYLAPAENIKAFAQSIVQLLEDNQLRQKMSTNCRQIAVEEYALELQAQRYIDVYKECLKYV